MHVIFCGSLQDGDCALSRGKDSKDRRDALSFAADLISLKKFFFMKDLLASSQSRRKHWISKSGVVEM